MKKIISTLIKDILFLAILLILYTCNKNNPGEPSGYSDISGYYKVEYSYRFNSDVLVSDISGSSYPHKIVQNGNNIYIGGCEGTISEDNTVQFKGCLISYGGMQEFNGKYNPALKIISGTFTGTTCEGGPYGTGRYDGTVSNGKFTLSPSDTAIVVPPIEPPDEDTNTNVSKFKFNSTQGNFSVAGNLSYLAAGTGIKWLDDSTIIAYDYKSFPVVSMAQLSFFGKPEKGSYSFNYLAAGKKALFFWVLNANINDTSDIFSKTCGLTNGNVNISEISGKNLTADFQGIGSFTMNPGLTLQVTNGEIILIGFTLSKSNNDIPVEIKKTLKLLNALK